MKRILDILPVVILSGYITLGNVTGFHPQSMKLISAVGLALMAAIFYLRHRAGGVSSIDKGYLIYMVFMAVAFWGFPQSVAPVAAYFPTGILYIILGAMVAVPALFAKRYFTEYFARKRTPEAVWETDIFKTINRHMTLAWAGIFAISSLITTVPVFLDLPRSLFTDMFSQAILPAALMVGVGVPLNRKYPRYYQRKIGVDPEQFSNPTPGKASVGNLFAVNENQKEENMSHQLKIVAINGSPKTAVSSTTLMIQMVASALSQEGIAVEEIFLCDKKIEYCVGCAVCLEKTKCWRSDDHAGITDRLFAADGIILASPVYFMHVTAQMKTFIDRSLSFGHKPRATTKPGMAITVSSGLADTATASYLEGILRLYGAFSVGSLIAIATSPGAFLGKEVVEARARDLAHDLARAIKEKRQYPVTGDQLNFYLFMRDLVTREKDFMRGDYQHWQETGLLEGFEAYVKQRFAAPPYDPAMRQEWLKTFIAENVAKGKEQRGNAQQAKMGVDSPSVPVTGPSAAGSCLDLLRMMPLGFKGEAVPGLAAVYQFEITGSEEFTAHLRIADGQCIFHEGPHEKPDVVIKSPADVWLAISKGEMDGQSAFLSGRYKVEGNMGLLIKIKGMFG